MSGQDGNRGYYYQAVVAILNACSNDSWSKICVEYLTDDDKVDIALLNEEEHVLNAIQVKSSINQFSTSNIKKWLKDVTNDVLADNYELILIGSCEKTANTFTKSIEKYYSSRMDNTLIESLFCEIAELEMLDKFAELIKNLYYFPFCINNSGKVSDTNLTVTLDLSNTSIQPFIIKGELNKEEMELLNVLSDWLVDEDIIASIFEASGNGAVTAEPDVRVNLHSVPSLPSNIFGKRKEYNIGHFLERFLDFQAKPDDFCNVSYEIKSLRAAESKWLSPFLYFVPKSEEFNIRYSILSEKLGEKIGGVIEGRLE